jgi:hypothetical protein
MTSSLVWGRIPAACGIAILGLTLCLAPAAAAADRSEDSGQLLLWLLGLTFAPENQRSKLDVNSATLEELRTVPGVEQRQALRIIDHRPYATLQDLARSGLSTSNIERLGRFLAVDPEWPSALPGPARVPTLR